MMSFVRDHVHHHGGAGGPGSSPAIAKELFDARFGAEGVGEHLGAAGGAFGKGGAGLGLRAARAIEFRGKTEMRCRKAEPFATDVVKVREDSGDSAGATRARLGAPGAGIQVTEEKLVDGVIDSEGFQEDVAHLDIG